MKKIQLTEAEIKTIEAYKNDEINTYSPENPEDQKNLDSVINKAEEILDEYPDDEFDEWEVEYDGPECAEEVE